MEFLENGTEVYVNDSLEFGYAKIKGCVTIYGNLFYIIDRSRLYSKIQGKHIDYDCDLVSAKAVRPVFTVLPKK